MKKKMKFKLSDSDDFKEIEERRRKNIRNRKNKARRRAKQRALKAEHPEGAAPQSASDVIKSLSAARKKNQVIKSKF